MTPNDAFIVVASYLLTRQCVCQEWENYPDIGEYDWRQIEALLVDMMDQLAPSPERYAEAYALLKERADAHAVRPA